MPPVRKMNPADMGGSFQQASEDGMAIKSLIMNSPTFLDRTDWLNKPALIVNKLYSRFPDRFTRYKRASLRQGIQRMLTDPSVRSHVHRELGSVQPSK